MPISTILLIVSVSLNGLACIFYAISKIIAQLSKTRDVRFAKRIKRYQAKLEQLEKLEK